MANPVSWFEIPVSDLSRAQKFYSAVFGSEFDVAENGPIKMAMFKGEPTAAGAAGALVSGPGSTPSQTGALVYFACDDLSNELKKIEENGGKVVMPKTDIGQWGFIAQFIDSENNRVALHSMK